MQRSTTVKVAAASALAAAALVAGGSAMALAQGSSSTSTPSASPSASASAGASAGTDAGRGPGGASQDTAVTGTEKDKVVAAVKAKDSAATITEVRKDPDGSYDAVGTKSGRPVFYDVSKDLATVTVRTGGPGGGHGGPGGASQDTAVTGTEKDKVVAAVEAKDSAVTVTEVRKDPDGSYDALGTKAGARVMVEVSKDLKTIEVRTGGPGDGHGMPGGAQGGTGTQSTNPSDANGASSTSSATTAAV